MNEKTAKKILKKVVKDYDSISDEFSNTRHYPWKEFEKYLEFIKFDDKIADIGCGNGRFLEFLNRKGHEFDYIGIDNSQKLIEIAKSKFKQAKFKNGDLLKIPIEDKSVDVAVAIASFHHIPSKKLKIKALKELSRILKDKGTLILSVWNLFQKKYYKYIVKSFFKYLYTFGKYDFKDCLIPWGKSGIKRYYYAFTNDELSNLLHECGFQIIEENTGNNINLICRKK